MIKGVIFDLDDTLISEKEYIKSGFKVVCNNIANDYNLNFDKLYNSIFEIFNEDSDYVFNRLLNKYNIDYDKEYIRELINMYRSHKPDIELYEDAKKILDYLYSNNYKLGIITDGYEITQKRKIEYLNIKKYFDSIIITDNLGKDYWKPHELPYKKCTNELGLNYKEEIYIGDNLKKDFITANKLGINTVQIIKKESIYNNTENNLAKEYYADYVIKELSYITTLYDL